jgi:hypothetical protein
MIGPVPRELEILNEVEVAMISLARIDGHVFSIEGGGHKAMTGWHTLYQNDVDNINKIANWCKTKLDDKDESEDEDEDSTSSFEDEDDHVNGNDNETTYTNASGHSTTSATQDDDTRSIKLRRIFVILSGPFTRSSNGFSTKKDFLLHGTIFPKYFYG